MQKYELMVIVDPDIGTDSINKKIAELKKMVESLKGKITFEDDWGLHEMAYAIKKHNSGYYYVLNFEAEANIDLPELDKTLRLDNEIIRHMLLKLPAVAEPKKYADIMAAWEEEQKEREAAKEEKKQNKKPAAKPAKKEAAVKEKQEEAKPADKTEDKPEPDEKKAEEVEEKLKNIIDNPDLNF
jgi:small subunit ribosomal protein S6